MKIQYIEKNFRTETLTRIVQANKIIEEYARDGYSLTLRQLYYQFVARDLIPNTERSYKALGSVISDGRLAGLISWEAIEDRTRSLKAPPHWDTPADIIRACATQFRYDLWEDQPTRIEVWVEKEALAGVVARTCNDLDIAYFACRGYVSQSEQWAAGTRHKAYAEGGQEVVVLHLGDHDPSGIDMTRDNRDRLDMFSENNVTVNRIALTMDQIEEYEPPPNPAKQTDARFEDYRDRYGDQSWELDALEPRVLDALIRNWVDRYIDNDLYRAAKARQGQAREQLSKLSNNWDQTTEFLKDLS